MTQPLAQLTVAHPLSQSTSATLSPPESPPKARDSLSFDIEPQLNRGEGGEDEDEDEMDQVVLAAMRTLNEECLEDDDEEMEDDDALNDEGEFESGIFDEIDGKRWLKPDGTYGRTTSEDEEIMEAYAQVAAAEEAEEAEQATRMVNLDSDEDDDSEEEADDMDDSKSEGELEAIQHEMQQLQRSVPALAGAYKLVDRLGEGTFSSVYKAIDLHHAYYDNSSWASWPPTDSSTGEPQPKGKVYVALKRIYVTSSPIRIQNELDILNDLRGTNNVAYLIAAIRHEDQVIAVMPFNRHQDFRTYYRTATLPLLRSYFACLFRALSSTHTQHIIHRDVKPANFLYDIAKGTGILCDYGLAQKIGGDEWYEWKSECCHSLPGPSWGGLEGRVRSSRKVERLAVGASPGLASGLHGVRLAKPISLFEQASKMEAEWKSMGKKLEEMGDDVETEEEDEHERMKPWIMPDSWRDDLKGRWRERHAFYKGWRPASLSSSAVGGGASKERVGYLKEDRRPSVRANRAGTRGFRAPEVLLKCPDQTVALDVWSAGIILLCFLTRRFPFFNSNDDTEALAEIAAIFGKKKIERCAGLHNRTFVTNIPTLETPPHATLHALVKALNPPIFVENSPNPYGPIPSSSSDDAKWYPESELYNAVDLMKRCLELDCTKRWTAEECLEHPFFVGLYDVGLGRTAPRSAMYT